MSRSSTAAFEESIGTARMARIPVPQDESSRVSLGNGSALRTRDHAAIVYYEPDELLGSVVPYLIEGLRAGDKVVYVADDLPTTRIAGALQHAGVDTERETRSGRLTIVDARAAFFPTGRFDIDAALEAVRQLAAQAERDGYARVRMSVEMTYLLAQVPGIDRAAEFESRANEEVFARFPFVCICSFNGARDVPDILIDVLQTHPVLLSNGIPLLNPYYRPWRSLSLDTAARSRWAQRDGTANGR